MQLKLTSQHGAKNHSDLLVAYKDLEKTILRTIFTLSKIKFCAISDRFQKKADILYKVK
jgi:hypothetical protein